MFYKFHHSTKFIFSISLQSMISFVADLFLFCHERNFMLSLSGDNQSEVIDAYSFTSRFLDDLLNIDNNLFDSMVNHIYLQNFSKIRPTSQIPRPHFWIYIYLY